MISHPIISIYKQCKPFHYSTTVPAGCQLHHVLGRWPAKLHGPELDLAQQPGWQVVSSVTHQNIDERSISIQIHLVICMRNLKFLEIPRKTLAKVSYVLHQTKASSVPQVHTGFQSFVEISWDGVNTASASTLEPKSYQPKSHKFPVPSIKRV